MTIDQVGHIKIISSCLTDMILNLMMTSFRYPCPIVSIFPWGARKDPAVENGTVAKP
jgi:hypothetical protein